MKPALCHERWKNEATKKIRERMKYTLDESRALPGPINASHHPGLGFFSLDAACDDADRPVCRRITLLRSLLRVPHVWSIWQVKYGMIYI